MCINKILMAYFSKRNSKGIKTCVPFTVTRIYGLFNSETSVTI